jgi:hypothetical protein
LLTRTTSTTDRETTKTFQQKHHDSLYSNLSYVSSFASSILLLIFRELIPDQEVPARARTGRAERMAPCGEAYNVDWVVSNNSNVHVANNPEWFTSYTPFETHFGTIYTNDCRVNVVGIGTVELNAKLHNQKRGGQVNSRVITLHDVLYAPSAICNIIGRPILSEYNVQLDYSQGRGFLKDKDDNRAGLIELFKLPRLRLHGQCEGTTSLGGGAYMINAQWPATERARWEAHPVTPYNGELYTTEEKAWLKANYGGEYKFLLTFGLSIYNEEDREEGRSVARGFMAKDNGKPKMNETREQILIC